MTGQVAALARQIIDRVYPVSVIVEFAAEIDPNAAIGCGTVWTRIEDGRALIASDVSHPVGWTGGTESVTLTIEQIPEHIHSIRLEGGSETDSQTGILAWSANIPYQNWFTGVTGGSAPHSNMQPSLAVCRWQRVA